MFGAAVGTGRAWAKLSDIANPREEMDAAVRPSAFNMSRRCMIARISR